MLGVTVIAAVAVLLPSTVFAVIVAVPSATPFTFPFSSTVATDVLLLSQVTFLFVAFSGATVAVSCTVFLASTVAVEGVTLTPVTATGSDASSIVIVSALPDERTVNRFALSSYERYLAPLELPALLVALVLWSLLPSTVPP